MIRRRKEPHEDALEEKERLDTLPSATSYEEEK